MDYRRTSSWLADREVCFRRYGRRCLRCRSTRDMSIDHIFPVADYPHYAHLREYHQPLCMPCNKWKATRIIDLRPLTWRIYFAFRYAIKITPLRLTIALGIYYGITHY